MSIRTLKTLDPDVYRNEAERNEMSLNESLNGSACLFGTDTETQSQADSAKPITENKLGLILVDYICIRVIYVRLTLFFYRNNIRRGAIRDWKCNAVDSTADSK